MFIITYNIDMFTLVRPDSHTAFRRHIDAASEISGSKTSLENLPEVIFRVVNQTQLYLTNPILNGLSKFYVASFYQI